MILLLLLLLIIAAVAIPVARLRARRRRIAGRVEMARMIAAFADEPADTVAAPASDDPDAVGAAYNRAVALGREGDTSGAIAAYETIVKAHLQAEGPIAHIVAESLFNMAIMHLQAGDRAGEMAAYHRLIEQFWGTYDPQIEWTLSRGVVNRGIALKEQGRMKEAAQAFDEALTRFSMNDQPGIVGQRDKAAMELAGLGVHD